MDEFVRYPWQDFPDVLIHAREREVKQHSRYTAAKSGDVSAAIALVLDTISSEMSSRLGAAFADKAPLLVPVMAEESAGTNPIPRVLAEVLGNLLGWELEAGVVQANIVAHTGASGFHRLATQAIFSGSVQSGLHYVLVDDFIGQGGTLANLRGHLLAQGGNVLGATVLTGKPYSAKVALDSLQLMELRRKHGKIETWWKCCFGFGFDCLTASEARYLIQTPTSERVIMRVGEIGGARSSRDVDGDTGPSS